MGVIYLVRHGQASIGRTNYDQLSDTGKQQSEILGREMRRRIEDINLIHTGTMQRHKQTLEHFNSAFRNIADVSVHREWDEYDHVDIIQQFNPRYRMRWYMIADMFRKFNPRRDFELMFDQAMDRWIKGDFEDDYAESWHDFRKRTVIAFNKVRESLGESGNAVVITSGGVISSIILHLLDLPDEYFMKFNKKIVNASVTKVITNHKSVFLSTLNDHGAFEGDRKLITYV